MPRRHVAKIGSDITARVGNYSSALNAAEDTNLVRDGLLALAMGLMLSIGLIFLLKHPDDRRSWPEEVERQNVLPGIYAGKPAGLSCYHRH